MTIVLALEDNTIHDLDVDSLKSKNWLTDSIIDYGIRESYYTLSPTQRSTICPLYASTVVLCTQYLTDPQEIGDVLTTFNLPHNDIIIIPVISSLDYFAVGGVHWSLLIFLRKSSIFPSLFFHNPKVSKPSGLKEDDPIFLHFDSSLQLNLDTARSLSNKLLPYLGTIQKSVELVPMPSPQQFTSGDCGVYLILFTSLLLISHLISFLAAYTIHLLSFSIHFPISF